MTNEEKVNAVKELILDGCRSIKEIMGIIDARDYSYIKPGAKLHWDDPSRRDGYDHTSGPVIVVEVDDDLDEIEDDSIIIVKRPYDLTEAGSFEVMARELYKKTREVCPCCGRRMYKSDVVGYRYVCLECDENFD